MRESEWETQWEAVVTLRLHQPAGSCVSSDASRSGGSSVVAESMSVACSSSGSRGSTCSSSERISTCSVSCALHTARSMDASCGALSASIMARKPSNCRVVSLVSSCWCRLDPACARPVQR